MKKNLIATYLKDFANLIFPDLCFACGESLLSYEKFICLHCEYALPKTHFEVLKDNPIEQIFWGRANINAATAFLRFEKGGRVQRLLHALKYHGQQELGVLMGEQMAESIADIRRFSAIDAIIPVPLHPKKFKKRLFNQSECLANGISKVLDVPVLNNTLIRKIFNPTQTRKSRYQRWENVDGIFELQMPKAVSGKHVLLVDDVVTTGSTLEACALPLLKDSTLRLSIITFAYA